MSQGMPGWLSYQGVAKGIDTLYNVKTAFVERSSAGCGGPTSAFALLSDTFAGVDWLVSSTPAEIVNYSYGGTATRDDSASARTWDQYVDSYGLIVSVAAGNAGPDSATIESPGLAYNIISAVNWVTRGTINSSSSRGPTAGGRYKPDIATPGTSIVSTAYNWDAGSAFVAKTGTSMAAPHVTGSAALLQSSGVPSGLATKAVLLNTTDNTGWAADRGWGYANPAAQPSFNITLAAPYSIPIFGSLTLEFTPDAVSQADDPAIQFSAGGRALNFTTPPALQTGTVAGAIKLTLRLTAGGQDITPSPAPSVTAQFGSQFLYTQPFTVQGDIGSVASVTVTLTNSVGSSQAVVSAF